MDFHIMEHVLSFQSQIMYDDYEFFLLSNVEFPIHVDRVIVESYWCKWQPPDTKRSC